MGMCTYKNIFLYIYNLEEVNFGWSLPTLGMRKILWEDEMLLQAALSNIFLIHDLEAVVPGQQVIHRS